MTDYPFLVFILSFLALWLAVWAGTLIRKRRHLDPEVREDSGVILGASLTLLGLLIGFSFSMAINRYDQRKGLEAVEANAIGTEYVRADLLPAADAAKVRVLLKSYLEQRILSYSTRDADEIHLINGRTAQLQSELWTAVLASAAARPTPIVALAVAGMNDVLNSQAFAQAAWLNRIPTAAWILMVAMGACCSLLGGYRVRDPGAEGALLVVLPFVVSLSLFFIADIDSPRGGFILVQPQNLTSLAESLR